MDPDFITRELRNEIDGLRAENAELKFHLYLDKPSVVVKKDERLLPGRKIHTTDAFTNTERSNHKPCSSGCEDLKKRFRRELEAADRIIEELKWSKVHHENKLIVQQLKIQELQGQVEQLRNSGLGILQFQVEYESPKPNSSDVRRRRRSCSESRRPSLSFSDETLPGDYKESVATLPPIGSPEIIKLTALPSKLLRYPLKTASCVPVSVLGGLRQHQPLKALVRPHKSN